MTQNELSRLEIPRETCWQLVEKYVLPESRGHLLAAEAAMAGLAKHFGEDEHTWAMVGLLHDIDYDQITSKDNYEQHMKEHCEEKCAEFLREINFPEELIQAIQSHNEVQNIPRNSRLAKALFAVDGLTGFIVAVAKIYPDKKLSSVKVKSVTKRMKEKRFAAAVNRDHIRTCETELGLPLAQFVEIGLKSIQEISDQLGL